MTVLITLVQLGCVWIAAWLMGLLVVKLLVPPDIEEEYGALVTPTMGYLTFCLVAFSLSATLSITAANASWIVMAILGLAGLATQARPAWRLRRERLVRDLRLTGVLVLPMAVATLFPLFYFGADTYLGAVNPDFFVGVVDNDYLLTHSVSEFEDFVRDTSYPVESIAGHLVASARFGSGLFAIAIKLLLGVETRTSLALAIAFFMLSLPLTVYVFCRVVMSFDHAQGRLAAWLMGISAPIAMSYLYYYVGQNSGLPALPLVMTCAFLLLTRQDVRTLLLCTLSANALFINYFAMLPYALAPVAPLGLYLLAVRRLPFERAVRLAFGFAAISAALVVGHLANTLESMQMWLGVIGQSLQGHYFLDFLTEAFFPYFFGIYNYQFSPWLAWLMGPDNGRAAGFVASMAVLAAMLWFVWRWARERATPEGRVFVLSAILIYAAVWALYSFSKHYGYAVFKMSSWLQFIVVPFMAYGIDRVWRAVREPGVPLARRAAPIVGLAVCAMYLALNVTATGIYGRNGLGRNTDTGYIVNHFGVSGNRDYFELPAAVARHVKPEESIGLMFTDSIRNWWTSYYLRDFRQSILSHVLIPGDDENLPDIDTNIAIDYYGNVERKKAEHFHGGTRDQYLLGNGAADINRDIVEQELKAAPLWENGSFRLYRANDLNDVLLTGRGFFRLEYFKPVKDYFFPRVLRWSAEGGEFLLLRPGRPGQPYRLSFDALVGYEYANDSRTIELWLNGRKFQEAVITHSARFVSEPFMPAEGANKLVVRIKERNRPLPRRFVLWNREIPTDYRRINIGFSNARIVPPEAPLQGAAPALETRVPFMQLHAFLERFNGLQLDGWVGEGAELAIPVPAGAKALRFEGFVPGNLGFTFPFKVGLVLNGREITHEVPAPGTFSAELPLQAGETRASLEIRPSQSKDLGDEAIRHKVVRSSLKLDALTFR